jgi:hypothetical protein
MGALRIGESPNSVHQMVPPSSLSVQGSRDNPAPSTLPTFRLLEIELMSLHVRIRRWLSVGILRSLDVVTCRHHWQHVAANETDQGVYTKLGEEAEMTLPEAEAYFTGRIDT